MMKNAAEKIVLGMLLASCDSALATSIVEKRSDYVLSSTAVELFDYNEVAGLSFFPNAKKVLAAGRFWSIDHNNMQLVHAGFLESGWNGAGIKLNHLHERGRTYATQAIGADRMVALSALAEDEDSTDLDLVLDVVDVASGNIVASTSIRMPSQQRVFSEDGQMLREMNEGDAGYLAYPLGSLDIPSVRLHASLTGEIFLSIATNYSFLVKIFDAKLQETGTAAIMPRVGDLFLGCRAPRLAYDAHSALLFSAVEVPYRKFRAFAEATKLTSIEDPHGDAVAVLAIALDGSIKDVAWWRTGNSGFSITAIGADEGTVILSGQAVGGVAKLLAFDFRNGESSVLKWTRDIRFSPDKDIIFGIKVLSHDTAVITGSAGYQQASRGSIVKGGEATMALIGAGGVIEWVDFLTQGDGSTRSAAHLVGGQLDHVYLYVVQGEPLTHGDPLNTRVSIRLLRTSLKQGCHTPKAWLPKNGPEKA